MSLIRPGQARPDPNDNLQSDTRDHFYAETTQNSLIWTFSPSLSLRPLESFSLPTEDYCGLKRKLGNLTCDSREYNQA